MSPESKDSETGQPLLSLLLQKNEINTLCTTKIQSS